MDLALSIIFIGLIIILAIYLFPGLGKRQPRKRSSPRVTNWTDGEAEGEGGETSGGGDSGGADGGGNGGSD